MTTRSRDERARVNLHMREPSKGEARLRAALGVEFLLANFGRFSLAPVMAILLASQSDGADWLVTGVGLFGFALFAGLSSLLVTSWLPRFPYSTTMPASLVLSAVGFGVLPYASSPVLILALLFVAGAGISVHAVLARVLVADSVASEPGRNTIYSIQQIAANAAAALGPFIAGALYLGGDSRPLLSFVGGAYLLGAAALFIGLERGTHPPVATRSLRRWSDLAGIARDPACRSAAVVTAVGAFAYAQFYSAFALLVAFAIDSTLIRSALLAGPPVAIVVLQALVTRLTNRCLWSGVAPLTILAVAGCTFGIAMAVLALDLPVVAGAIAAMCVFALAEMLFTPMVSVTFNRICSVSRLQASNLQAVAWTSGEALGSLSGGALFLLCYDRGVGGLYWFALAVFTVTGAAPFLLRAHRHPERTPR